MCARTHSPESKGLRMTAVGQGRQGSRGQPPAVGSSCLTGRLLIGSCSCHSQSTVPWRSQTWPFYTPGCDTTENDLDLSVTLTRGVQLTCVYKRMLITAVVGWRGRQLGACAPSIYMYIYIYIYVKSSYIQTTCTPFPRSLHRHLTLSTGTTCRRLWGWGGVRVGWGGGTVCGDHESFTRYYPCTRVTAQRCDLSSIYDGAIYPS